MPHHITAHTRLSDSLIKEVSSSVPVFLFANGWDLKRSSLSLWRIERARERERERGNERCESGGGGGEEEEDALETWIRGSLASVLVFFLPPARVATTKGSDILLSCAWPKKKKCLRNKYYHAHSGLGSPSPWATIMICF